MIELEARCATDFHRELLTRDWLTRLSAVIAEQPGWRGRSGEGTVTPRYPEATSGSLPYRFTFECQSRLGPLLDLCGRGELRYFPDNEGRFWLKRLASTYRWAPEALDRDRETLARIAVEAGVLQPAELFDFRPDPDLTLLLSEFGDNRVVGGTVAGETYQLVTHPLDLGAVDASVPTLLGKTPDKTPTSSPPDVAEN